ncbi:MAG: fluoride efflux transporter CrcB [Ruminococcus sp.]|jgi:CrcB protein
MMNCLIVGLGGFIGSVCRYLIGLIPINERYVFPVKTFAINIIGCFIIGIIAAASLKNTALNPKLVLLLKVGVCGGFTTFSSFALETGDLMKNVDLLTALAYVVLSAFLGVLAVFAGQAVIK